MLLSLNHNPNISICYLLVGFLGLTFSIYLFIGFFFKSLFFNTLWNICMGFSPYYICLTGGLVWFLFSIYECYFTSWYILTEVYTQVLFQQGQFVSWWALEISITEPTHPLLFLPEDFYHADHKMKIGAFRNVLELSVQNNGNEILPGFLKCY